ncbi:MAG: PQQ-dependent sugar dehydrogenase, partial [Bacteroidota bacterium]
FLYIALGDGGSGGDPIEAGEDPTTLLGALLRIDVDGAAPYAIPEDNPFAGNQQGAREEIWAYGLRNPWRFSFDPATERLWLADVGQNAYEEVNVIERGGNYGWDHREGPACFEPSVGCATGGFIAPRHSYPHTLGRSITGGYVYRGARVPEMTGRYLFADYASGRIWSLDAEDAAAGADLFDQEVFNISTFGADEQGELYAARIRGQLYRLESSSGVDVEAEQPTTTARLSPPYPNPFVGRTTVQVEAESGAALQVEVFDLLGRSVATLWRGVSDGTPQVLRWDGATAEGQAARSGLYLIRVQQDGRSVATQAVTLLAR